MSDSGQKIIPMLIVFGVLVLFVIAGLLYKTREGSEYGLAGRYTGRIGGGAAIASNWMSAASFIGIAGIIYFSAAPTLQGSVINPPVPAASIDLMNFDGRPFSLNDARGKVTLLYFGYTNCPDECPLMMAHLKLAVDALGSGADQIVVAMVTTDPMRDSPDTLRQFLGKFDPSFVGLTGSNDDLATVWKGYGVTVLNGGETHSNYLYVIDPSGDLVETFLTDAAPEIIAADVRLLLKGK